MTAVVDDGLVMYRGRSLPSSLNRGRAVLDDPASHNTLLWVGYHVQDYIFGTLYSALGERADDLGESAAAGAEPIAVDIQSELTRFDATAGRDNDFYQSDGGHVRLFENTTPGVGATGTQFPGYAPFWSTFPGWPDPPDSGNLDLFSHTFNIQNFASGDAPSGLIPRMRIAAGVYTVGTGEFTTDVESPGVAWDADPMWDLEDCIVVRGVILTNESVDPSTVSGLTLDITAHRDFWDWDNPTRPRGDLPTVVFSTDYGYAQIDSLYTGATLNGSDVLAAALPIYTSPVASEDVFVYTIVLGFGIPDEVIPPGEAGGAEPFEFTQRWATMGPALFNDTSAAVDILERHDQELEENFRLHGCGDFEYTYRWPTFYADLLAGNERAIFVMEERDRELEEASAHQGEGEDQVNDGSCAIELTHRWPQIIGEVRARSAVAWELLEQRDREIEEARSACACLEEDPGGT